ncbi:hypothetical protein ACSS6W_002033 [Trichoderma asperelloides]
MLDWFDGHCLCSSEGGEQLHCNSCKNGMDGVNEEKGWDGLVLESEPSASK